MTWDLGMGGLMIIFEFIKLICVEAMFDTLKASWWYNLGLNLCHVLPMGLEK